MIYAQIFSLAKKMADCLSGIQIDRYPATDAGLLAFLNQHLYGMVKSLEDTGLNEFASGMEPGMVYEITSRLSMVYLVIPLPEKDMWVVGPCLKEAISDSKFNRILEKNRGLVSNPTVLKKRLQSLPLITQGRLNQLGQLLAQQIYPNKEIQYRTLEEEVAHGQPTLVEDYAKILPMRYLEQRYENSNIFVRAAANGNYNLAHQQYAVMFPDISQIRRTPDPLRNVKNLLIILNTTLRHALQQSGVHPYMLDKLSDQISQQIEDLHAYDKFFAFGEEMLRQYCQLACDNSAPNAKPIIKQVAAYVKWNLSDNLTTQDMAESLNLNPDYFAHLFSREMGISFKSYVNQERLHQAADLLGETDLPIQQIGMSVGFNSASYFTKQFRIAYGMTPAAYRKGLRGKTKEEGYHK